MFLSSLIGAAASLATLPGTLELTMLTVGGVLPPQRRPTATSGLGKMAVVVPAHNERHGIAECLESLRNAERPKADCQVVVIADNCTDNTAEIATRVGATVWERKDMEEGCYRCYCGHWRILWICRLSQ